MLRIMLWSDPIPFHQPPSAYSKVGEAIWRGLKGKHRFAHTPMAEANNLGIFRHEDMLVYPSGREPFGEDVIQINYSHFNADMVIFLKDLFTIDRAIRMPMDYLFYAPIDHSPISPLVESKLRTAFRVVAMSYFGEDELVNKGIKVHATIPHGYDPTIYFPRYGVEREKARSFLRLKPDAFIVGFIGVNRPRKLVPRMLQVFKKVLEKSEDKNIYLMLYTDVEREIPLLPIIRELGLEGNIYWPERELYQGGISEREMWRFYCAVDVVCCVSGEGFWLPGIEAQACFEGSTKIVTYNGLKPISSIAIGDCVLTHRGRFRRVSEVFQRSYSGPMVRITPWSRSDSIFVTPEHPILAYHSTISSHSMLWLKGWISASSLLYTSNSEIVFPRGYEPSVRKKYDLVDFDNSLSADNNNVWYKMGFSGKTGELCKYPRYIKIDENLASVLGLYIAEGSSSPVDSYVTFSLNRDEETLADDLKSKMAIIFGVKPTEIKREQRLEIFFSGKILSKFFASLCGRGARRKKIPSDVLWGPSNLLTTLVTFVTLGDGYQKDSRIRISTSSSELANQLWISLIRIGFKPTLNLCERGDYEVSYALNNIQNGIHSNKTFIRGEDGRLFTMLLKDVSETPYTGLVYNLQVEEDNSYCTQFCAVHNCGTPIVVADYGAAPELVGSGFKAKIADWTYINEVGVRQPMVDADDMADKILQVKNGDPEKFREKALEFAKPYTWEHIINKQWVPLLAECEEELKPMITSEGLKPWDQEVN